VISEFFAPHPFLPSGDGYHYGQYIEVYNNSDTAIYLDGKLIGRGPWYWFAFPVPGRSCPETDRWRNDPEGIWSRFITAFPGRGRDYPLPPGAAVAIATDAIDHSAIFPGLLDLRGAGFEFIGTNDVDNPSVPNMVNLGPEFGIVGHQPIPWGVSDEVFYLADTVDLASLPYAVLPSYPEPQPRIPRSKILDVLGTRLTPEAEAGLSVVRCYPQINRVFDLQPTPLIDASKLYGIARRVFTRLPDGRVILLRTKNSLNDFIAQEPRPGEVP
jgi:hypothetical protein